MFSLMISQAEDLCTVSGKEKMSEVSHNNLDAPPSCSLTLELLSACWMLIMKQNVMFILYMFTYMERKVWAAAQVNVIAYDTGILEVGHMPALQHRSSGERKIPLSLLTQATLVATK